MQDEMWDTFQGMRFDALFFSGITFEGSAFMNVHKVLTVYMYRVMSGEKVIKKGDK